MHLTSISTLIFFSLHKHCSITIFIHMLKVKTLVCVNQPRWIQERKCLLKSNQTLASLSSSSSVGFMRTFDRDKYFNLRMGLKIITAFFKGRSHKRDDFLLHLFCKYTICLEVPIFKSLFILFYFG